MWRQKKTPQHRLEEQPPLYANLRSPCNLDDPKVIQILSVYPKVP